jgi:ribose transport system permease protein
VSDLPAPEAARVQREVAVAIRPRQLLERFGALLVLVGLIVFFSLLLPATFPTYANLTTILTTQDVLAILAIGLLVPLAAGEFDLSIGFVLGFTGMEVAVLTGVLHWHPVPAIVLTLATAVLIGLINGLLVVRVGINAFIATLGVGTVLSGLTIWMSNGTVVYQGIPDLLLAIGRTQLLLLPLPVFYMIIVIIVFSYIMGHTPFGRYIYAVGGGREVARLAGINTDLLTILAFTLSGFMAGIAGVLETATVGAAHPDVGPQFLLPAFAAAFLGATTIQPGRFNVLGTVVALFLLAVGIAGFQQLGAPFWVSPVFNGTALLIAVGLAVRRGSGRVH